jgi:hypothetical protein
MPITEKDRDLRGAVYRRRRPDIGGLPWERALDARFQSLTDRFLDTRSAYGEERALDEIEAVSMIELLATPQALIGSWPKLKQDERRALGEPVKEVAA